MALITPTDYINVGGKVDIYVAFSPAYYVQPVWPFVPARPTPGSIPSNGDGAYEQLFKLGELEDEVEPRYRNMVNRVSGDRYGGGAGDAIENQHLGQMAEVDLALSRWDTQVWNMMKSNGGLTAGVAASGQAAVTGVKLLLSNYGALMQRDRSFRLLLVPSRNPGMIRNFPCCLIERDFGSNVSTKYSRLSVSISAHRAPEGHWADPTGSATGSTPSLVIGWLENDDTQGLPTDLLPIAPAIP